MKSKSYFFRTFIALLVATTAFLIFKALLPKKLFPESKVILQNVTVDSLLLKAAAEAKVADTIFEDTEANLLDSIASQKIVFDAVEGIVFPTESYANFQGNQYLIPFYEQLFQLEKDSTRSVRIAYYSDSMTDGDLIVQDVRTAFQNKFGGEGVGFVNITSESAASRSSVTHQFSSNWKSQSYLRTQNPNAPFGVNGHVFFTNDSVNSPWVRYKANWVAHAKSLPKPTLFFGASDNKNGELVIINKEDSIVKKLSPTGRLNTLLLTSNYPKALKINFKNADSIPFYGFNFDNGRGVHVDNFSSRGNSGLPISMFQTSLMNEFQKHLGYDLIVLHYGTNILSNGSKQYGWYGRRMERIVAHLKKCFPGVSILIVSTADKATKYDLEMKSDSAVVPLVRAQKEYALASKSGFVNLYELMGGAGSMVKWVDTIPAKANKDYTHFNYRGSKEVASYISNQIFKGYNTYKKLRKNKIKIKAKVKSDSLSTVKDSIHVQ